MIYYQKGGAEIVLEACTQLENNQGSIVSLNKSDVNKAVEKMASKGLRVIALAYKQDGNGGSNSSLVNSEALRGSNKSNRSGLKNNQRNQQGKD